MKRNKNNILEEIKLSLEDRLLSIKDSYNKLFNKQKYYDLLIEEIETELTSLMKTYENDIRIITSYSAILILQGKFKESVTILKAVEHKEISDRNYFWNYAVSLLNLKNKETLAEQYFKKSNTKKSNELTIESYFDCHAQ